MNENLVDLGKPSDPPPSPPPPQHAAVNDESEPGRIETTVYTGDIKTEALAVIGQLKLAIPDPANPVSFSIESAWKVTPERADMTSALFVAEPKLVDDLASELEKRRVLLLSGERGTGKATLAIYLSTLVARRAKMKKSTLVVDPLDRQVRIDIRSVVEKREHFGERAMIFTDAFARKNRNLISFFERTAHEGWEDLAGTLRANSAYLIFTAETHDAERFRELANCIACRTIAPLTRDLVERGLDRKLAWLAKNKLASDDHLRVATERREHIINCLNTLQRVAQFLDFYVTRDPDFDAALQRFNDVGFWFSEDLAADVDAWCFALTLALAQSARDLDGVGWYEFEQIRRAITERLKADTELFPRRRRSDAHELETGETTAGQSFSDDRLLTRCRAAIGKDSSRLGDAVRFLDPSYASTIWQHAVTHNRRVLTMLLPALRALAEEPGDYGVRALAAQMIGRIGELDPFSISIPILRNEWVHSERQRPFVGRLLQGMRASENAKYKQSALSAIDALTADRPGNPAEENDGLLTAISAYSQLGEDDPETAMKRLGTIAIDKLAPVMTNLNEIGRVAEIVGRSMARTPLKQQAEDLLMHRIRLARFARQLAGRRAAAIVAMTRALVYLCLMSDPVQVLRAMREWISIGDGSTGALVALLFLHGGIAEELETVAGNVRSVTGGTSLSPIVLSLTNSRDAGEHLSAFLADVHSSANAAYSLPSGLQQELRDSFGDCLTAWARGSLAEPAARDAVVDLFVVLTIVRNGAMRNDIYALFSTAAFTDAPALRDFAAEVRCRRLQRAGDFS